MSLRLSLMERHVPASIRRRLLRRLVRATADAFGADQPRLPDPCDATFIRAYAHFTRGKADRLRDESAAAAADVRRRLYTGAHELGRTIRRWAGIRTPGEAVRALRLIYAAIGIELEADLESGMVTVRRCAFSEVYTPAVCDFVSALDAGLFQGVSGGWCVAFNERITAGAAACRARLTEAFIP